MKKIPTLFERTFKDHNVVDIKPNVTSGMEWVLENRGIATLKIDGTCTCMLDGVFYKRYDAKNGKPVPEGAIKCQETADPVTGHLPCWVKVDKENPSDKWFVKAYEYTVETKGEKYLTNGTYEVIGKHFRGNPYHLDHDEMVRHGETILPVNDRSFEGIKKYLSENEIEGIVFWLGGEPKCKIKRSDFGYDWNKLVSKKKQRK